MNDTIYRQAACNALDNIEMRANETWYDFYRKALNALTELAAAQPEADEVARDMATIIENEKDMRVIRENAEYQWIPCSKKMPPVHGIFLASIRTLSGYIYVATVTHDDKGRPFCFETGPLYLGSYEMIAWRPLPDPYEGENDG
jgi:hypothetical protein